MRYTAKLIAQYINGEIVGNPDAEISDIAKIEEGKVGSLSFLANPKYEKYIYETSASVVIVNKTFVPEKNITCTLIKVDDAYKAIAFLLSLYQDATQNKTGIEKPCHIEKTVKKGKDIYIGAFAYIGKNVTIGNKVKIYPHVYIGDNVSIDDNTCLYSGVKIYYNCIIGKNCTIHAGTVIGSDGFGFAPQSDNNYQKVPQVGNVILEDNVEIGSNCSIDRATMGSTIIRNGVKLDNLIQVAHNVEIGKNTVIAAQTGIAGSAKIGADCMIAGQVGIVGHLQIGDKVKIAAQSGVSTNVENEKIVMGSPAYDISNYRRSYVIFRNLPDIREQISLLEKELKELKNKQMHNK
jgi:UDP-3-O-[3-hydroxymyristoyl] glucosamine N-acyltransferase